MAKAKFSYNATYPTAFVAIHCPACGHQHVFPVEKVEGYPVEHVWGWNGSMDSPTFTPSLMLRTGKYVPGYETKFEEGTICHSVVTDGKIAFCGDCTHEMAGQTVDLLDVSEWP